MLCRGVRARNRNPFTDLCHDRGYQCVEHATGLRQRNCNPPAAHASRFTGVVRLEETPRLSVRCYSSLSTTLGSTRDARHAGRQLATAATAIDTVSVGWT